MTPVPDSTAVTAQAGASCLCDAYHAAILLVGAFEVESHAGPLRSLSADKRVTELTTYWAVVVRTASTAHFATEKAMTHLQEDLA